MKLKRLIVSTSCVLMSVGYAANPVTKAYVDAQDQRLQAQIDSNNSSSSGSGHYIGEYYQGGVIFWLDGTTTPANRHGLIADIADKPPAKWSTANTTTNATLDGAYQGKNSTTACGGSACNTAKIIATAGATYPAASACATSTSQGYTDWYLPSLQELSAMNRAQMAIQNTALAHGGSAFVSPDNSGDDLYWSSTEGTASTAWSYYFSNGGNQDHDTKNSDFVFRCIRAF